MTGCHKKEILKTFLSRFDLEAWTSFSLSIVKHVVQSIYHSGFSSKIQIIAANVFDQIWTSARGGGRIRLYGILIE